MQKINVYGKFFIQILQSILFESEVKLNSIIYIILDFLFVYFI
jgi:hypothetical protein